MSEYQYYELQAIDRPLTQEQMEKLRSYSTRARITRRSFVNDYSRGDFKGDEDVTLVTELRRRVRKHSDRAGANPEPSAARRTVGELLQAAEARAEKRRQAEARRRKEEAERRERQAAIARAKYLDGLASRQPQLWARVEKLIAETKPKTYKAAIKLLIDLRDLAQREGTDRQFRMKLDAIHVDHSRKPALIERLRKAGL